MRQAIVLASNGHPQNMPLKYAKADGDRIARVLASERCGFRVLTLPADDPWVARRAIHEVLFECAPNDEVVVYFSGHGAIVAGELFLLLDGTEASRAMRDGLPVRDVLAPMSRSQAANRLLILDCCNAAGAVVDPGTRDTASTEDLQLVGRHENFQVLMASGRFDRAREFDELGGGFMTHHLCELLEGRNNPPSRSGPVTVEVALQHLQNAATVHNELASGQRPVPLPRTFGRSMGRFELRRPQRWVPWYATLPLGIELTLLPIAPGSRSEPDSAEGPVARFLGRTVVTNAQYRMYIEGSGMATPEGEEFAPDKCRGWKGRFRPWEAEAFSSDDQPVVCVSLGDARRFCSWLSRRAGGFDVFLPPPGLWDFGASFGGSRLPSNAFDMTVWQQREATRSVVPGLEGAANSLGLGDMFGNVWEWCEEGSSSRLPLRVVSVAESGHLRGGSFLDDVSRGRVTLSASELQHGTDTRHSDIGFRVAAAVPATRLPQEVRLRLDEQTTYEDALLQVRYELVRM